MAIKSRNLIAASARSARTVLAKSINEAQASGTQTAFLCHSHIDKKEAKGLQILLKESGWDLYIDWQDIDMPSAPNEETARMIKLKIKTTDWFLFLATSNSIGSRWCPWEIGDPFHEYRTPR